ncbi:MAG: aromatic amino acid lyase, partial [Methylobacteriaceae bacterium]|nr:aromatic amino acid lyase [Methylobacteriaceae bacterium]
MPTSITIKPSRMRLAGWREIHAGAGVALDPGSREAVERGSATVAAILARDEAVYGINTGFGKLAQTRIRNEDVATLQRNLVLSHAAGVGPPLPRAIVRLAIALKIASLARGHSGVRLELIEALLALPRHDIVPVIPSQGSVGASGALAPLAHLSAALIGEGDVIFRGVHMAASDALRWIGLDQVVLGPKEGLALLNGTQVSTALALAGLFAMERVFAAALVAGAMTLDAIEGSDTPYDERIHALRGHAGQRRVAAALRGLAVGSAIRESHRGCAKVQDPYSLRCQPQVMGA